MCGGPCFSELATGCLAWGSQQFSGIRVRDDGHREAGFSPWAGEHQYPKSPSACPQPSLCPLTPSVALGGSRPREAKGHHRVGKFSQVQKHVRAKRVGL